MKEYLTPLCALIRTEPEDVIATSSVVLNGTLNMDDPSSSDYGKIFWDKNQLY